MKRIICFFKGHDWDIAYHGPGGSGFVCCRCPATWNTGDKKPKEVPWAGFITRRRFQKRLRETPPLKIEDDVNDLFKN